MRFPDSVWPYRTILLACVSLALVAAPSSSYALNEQKLGEQYHQELQKQYRVYKDPRVTEIGRRVSDVAGIHDVEFFAIDMGRNDQPNAFQIPNHIYATKSLLKEFDDTALTFILGHELGHQNGHHLAKQVKKNQTIGIGAAILGAIIGVRPNTVGDYAINIAGGALVNQYSREQETEADTFGLEVLHDLGIPYQKAADSFKKLAGDRKEDKTMNTLFGSHPLMAKRIQNAASAGEWLGMRAVDVFDGPAGHFAVVWPHPTEGELPPDLQRLRQSVRVELSRQGIKLAVNQPSSTLPIWTRLSRLEVLEGQDIDYVASQIKADRMIAGTRIDKGRWQGVILDAGRKERQDINWDATNPARLASQIASAASSG
ncbi:MAG: M48 family metalloprotease [Armatimonadetes bacterium]|nr:M48 family metalloprotease [Armatimonadota bacterium]